MRKFIIAALLLLQCSPLGAEPLRVGTTFSAVQCEYLGLDWKEAYLSILDKGFDLIRLGAYWSEIEKEEDTYEFSALDWQITEARKRGIPVVLTVGMKAPRWPEYFIPGWVLEKARLAYGADVSKNEYLKGRAVKFIKQVVNHYNQEKIIRYWQVENEPLNRMGEKHWFIGEGFLKEEVELVRRLDGKKRPILLTAATYPNKFLRLISYLSVRHDPIKECLELGDIIGLNIYPIVGHRFWGFDVYFKTTRNERDRYFSRLISRIRSKGKEVWIVELQAEPWEPGQLIHTGEKRPLTGEPNNVRVSFKEFRALGIDTILLWGAEYWLYREMRHKDEGWHKMVKGLLGA